MSGCMFFLHTCLDRWSELYKSDRNWNKSDVWVTEPMNVWRLVGAPTLRHPHIIGGRGGTDRTTRDDSIRLSRSPRRTPDVRRNVDHAYRHCDRDD